MSQTYPNPWDFHNTDTKMVSANKFQRIRYYDLNEIAMGAPIGGQCYLETSDNKKVKIHDWCGGPPAWETKGLLVAIPIWTRQLFKGTVQQIGIVDTQTMELKIFAKTFSVLDLRSFDNKLIYGYDSPIKNTKNVMFEIEEQKIDRIIKLTS